MGFFSRIKKFWDGEEQETSLQEQTGQHKSIPEDNGTPEEPTPSTDAHKEKKTTEEPAPSTDAHKEKKTTEEPAPSTDAHKEKKTTEEPAPSTDAHKEKKVLEESHQEQEARVPEKKSFWKKLFSTQGEIQESPEDIEHCQQEELLFQEKPQQQKTALEPWQQELLQALHSSEPRLSLWMEHLMLGVSKRGEGLWSRLYFLFDQLDIPRTEAENFIASFDAWLEDMEYDRVEEFRSELQYRMALALELEDEEDERSRLFIKLSAGLEKTRAQITERLDQLLALGGGYDEAFWEEFEEILLMADVGLPATQKLLERIKPKLRYAETRDAVSFKALLKEELTNIFPAPKTMPPTKENTPEVVLMVGVNGAGKTTTIAKLAYRAQMQGRHVLVAAGDTFRAAAIEQLQVWSKRIKADFYAKPHGSDPAAVAFEALDHAHKEHHNLVFIDTAGRLQTKHNLMEELKKINRVLGKKQAGAPHRTILVLDATTGQNALSQVKLFSQATPIDEIILTKLDGTAKGGVIIAIALEYGLPVSFVGLGEKMEDLQPFSGEQFVTALLG